ncbi:MAG: type I restriction endonuclease subunit R [Paeniclostridium sordellii]|nr:type I restriction endonuclease subunit R [Paeniclostridium sordellii]
MGKYSEDSLVQQTVINHFKHKLKWETEYAYNTETFGENGTLGRSSEKEVILVRYLKQSLKKLNPNLPESAYKSAIDNIVENNISKTLLDINEEKYNIFKNGVEVEYKNDKGINEKRKLRVFDFDDYENNHFLAVRELYIQGRLYRRRSDIIGFVNGIPLLFIELKNIHKDIKNAYEDNLKDYKDTITYLFNYNAIVILSNGLEGKVGSVTSKYEYFHDWKRIEEDDEGKVNFEVMLDGICSKENFMDIFENFILFDDSGDKKAKIVARNHQYIGVNRAIESFKNSKENNDTKLGVFWHTQGSGKSYSIVFFSQKILRKVKGNHSFLVVTDRSELDEQIYNTFVGCGAIKANNNIWATSGDHLRQLLKEDHRYVFTLIHKFNEKVNKAFENSENVIVISDEAHRSQYGLLAKNMRDSLPDAKFIGFTGTPLFKEDEITKKLFGDYVSVYDFSRAVEDGATVPLYYESRGEKLGIVNEEINDKIQSKLDDYDLTDEQEEKLSKVLAREYHILTSNERLDDIARDIVNHYSTMWESGKAMLVCIDKVTCVKMYNLIDKYWKLKIKEQENDMKNCLDEQDEKEKSKKLKWLKETEYAVVVSEEQNEIDKFKKWDLDIIPHREKMKKRDLATEFKDNGNPFRLAIVCAMWLTGFDVKSLSILYLDKVLKEHTLMQTIARANRVYEGKNNGLIVDYIGVLKNLREALSKYGSGVNTEGGESPIGKEEELIDELVDAIRETKLHLGQLGFDINKLISINEDIGFEKIRLLSDAKEAIYSSEESKKKFEILARAVIKKYKACVFNENINKYTKDYEAINAIYKLIKGDKRNDDITHIIRDLHAIVDDAILTQEVRETDIKASGLYDISKIDFNRLKDEFKGSKRKNTMMKTLQDRIEEKLNCMINKNSNRMDFYKRYQDIIYEYNKEKDRSTIEATFDDLLDFLDSLNNEEKRAAREGLTEESLVIMDLLEKPNLSQREREKIKQMSEGLLDEVKSILKDIDNWREKAQTSAKVKSGIYDYLYKNLPESYDFDEIDLKRDIIYNHFYENYNSIVDSIYS